MAQVKFIPACVTAPFLIKTYGMVDDPTTNDVVSWNDDGTSFVVWKYAEFAKDVLPTYFKHNNFSSFVRQLNTYGFRKIVPDKWEFANENFKQGQKNLLKAIRRRKTVDQPLNSSIGKPKTADNPSSPVISGEDLASSSTSSPGSQNPSSLETLASVQIVVLTEENETLKKENQILSSELAQTKKKYDELLAFVSQHVKVGPDQISRVVDAGGDASGGDDASGADDALGKGDMEFDDDENENCLKLFGVVLGKKRGRSENIDFCVPQRKEMKGSVEVTVPWMNISTSPVD